ncbi:DUF4097 domain-containing protein [candidate division WOR-3 bacterium]|nr:DUF4097 domain-containing protein [candidate division WOR-3 bacterium]
MGAAMTAAVRTKVRVAVSTGNGGVTLSGMTAGADVSTSSGKVTADGTEGDLHVTTTNGDVTLRVHRGSAAISTTNGDVECDLSLLEPTGRLTINTTNGTVTVLLPADVSASVEATTTNGDVLVSGFQFQYEEQTATHIKGRIGSGAATVTIETTNGDVSIRPRT